jgi:hypothetical protein
MEGQGGSSAGVRRCPPTLPYARGLDATETAKRRGLYEAIVSKRLRQGPRSPGREVRHCEVRLSQPGDHIKQITSAMFTPIFGVMQHLDLSDEKAAALIKKLAEITGNDRYPFSPRIQTLTAILAKLKPEPARDPWPSPKVYAPPRGSAARRRRAGEIRTRNGCLARAANR